MTCKAGCVPAAACGIPGRRWRCPCPSYWRQACTPIPCRQARARPPARWCSADWLRTALGGWMWGGRLACTRFVLRWCFERSAGGGWARRAGTLLHGSVAFCHVLRPFLDGRMTKSFHTASIRRSSANSNPVGGAIALPNGFTTMPTGCIYTSLPLDILSAFFPARLA